MFFTCFGTKTPLGIGYVLVSLTMMLGGVGLSPGVALGDEFARPHEDRSVEVASRAMFKDMQDKPVWPQFGVLLDTGLPDGINLGLSYRPLYWLRVHAGVSHNFVGFGMRAGASVIPLTGFVSPSLVVEGGHFFRAQAGGILESIVETKKGDEYNYSYGNLHLGLELRTRQFTFFLRAGYSVVDVNLGLSEERFTDIRLEEDFHGTIFTPSAKLGVVVYFL